MIAEFIRIHAGRGEGDGLPWGIESIYRVLPEQGMQIAPVFVLRVHGREAVVADVEGCIVV